MGQLPRLQTLQSAYNDAGARIVAVVERGRPKAIKDRYQLSFPVLYTGTHLYGYWIVVSPEVYVLDREHRFVANLRGYSDWGDNRVRELLDMLVGRRSTRRPDLVESP